MNTHKILRKNFIFDLEHITSFYSEIVNIENLLYHEGGKKSHSLKNLTEIKENNSDVKTVEAYIGNKEINTKSKVFQYVI